MLITRETDYALRILRALHNDKQLTAAEIAKGEQIPQQFAYKILKKLKTGHLVNIYRGITGGYVLAVDLRKISLYDLIEIVDGGEKLAHCMQPGYQCQWRQARGNSTCKAHINLLHIQQEFVKKMQGYNLYDILFK